MNVRQLVITAAVAGAWAGSLYALDEWHRRRRSDAVHTLNRVYSARAQDTDGAVMAAFELGRRHPAA